MAGFLNFYRAYRVFYIKLTKTMLLMLVTNYRLVVCLLVGLLLIHQKAYSNNTYFSESQFLQSLARESQAVKKVYQQFKTDGTPEFALVELDMRFLSDKAEKLQVLVSLMAQNYRYHSISIEQASNDLWALTATTNGIPVSQANLTFWMRDWLKLGYQHDVHFYEYGAWSQVNVQRFPDFSAAMETYYFEQGMLLFNQGNVSHAIIAWHNALQIDPNSISTLYSLAIAKAQLFAPKAAIDHYDKVIELDPNFASAWLNRGAIKDDMGDCQGALRDYRAVINLAARYVDKSVLQNALFNLGEINLELNNQAVACQYWRQSFESGSELAPIRLRQYCNRKAIAG